MPRKKIAVAEVEPAETPTKKQIVAAKHTVTYEAPEVVEVPMSEEEILLDDFPDEFQQEEIRNRQPSLKTKLREKFKARGIGGNEIMTLRIDRLPNFEINGHTSIKSDKEFCGSMQCTEDYFDNDNYLVEILRRYGPGEYWLTVRHKNTIVQTWRERVGGYPAAMPIVQAENGAQSPAPFYPYAQQPPAPPKSMKEELRDVAEMMALMDKIRGPQVEPTLPPMSDELQFASVLLKDPAHAKKIVKNLIGGEGGEQSLTVTIIENAPSIIEALTSGIQKIIADISNARNGNGQTQIHPQTFSQNNPDMQRSYAETVGTQAITQSATVPPSQTDIKFRSGDMVAQVSPEDQILNHLFSFVIEQCAQNTTPELVAAGIDRFMDEQVSADMPLYFDKVWSQLEDFAGMDTELVIAYVKTLPNGAAVASLPHAKEWTARLQELLKPEEMEAE